MVTFLPLKNFDSSPVGSAGRLYSWRWFILPVSECVVNLVGVTLAKGHGREAIKRTLAIGWDSLHSAMDSPTV